MGVSGASASLTAHSVSKVVRESAHSLALLKLNILITVESMMRSDALGFFWEDVAVVKKAKAEKFKRTAPEPTWERPDYLPGLERAMAYTPPELTLQDIAEMTAEDELIFDIESYPNYFLASFLCRKTGRVLSFERSEWKDFDSAELLYVLEKSTTVGFNNIPFDIPIATLAARGRNCKELHDAVQMLIVDRMRPSDVLKAYKAKKLTVNTIDLIEVAPLQGSLKIYSGRLHTDHMQDLPFAPGTVLSREQAQIVKFYNIYADLRNTNLLREALEPQIALRYVMSNEYGVDLRSKSDPQVAEAVIIQAMTKENGRRPIADVIVPGTTYQYRAPACIKFSSPLLQWALARVQGSSFVVGESGSVEMPQAMKELSLSIGNSVYTMGIGGLHSTESTIHHVSDNYRVLKDRDVTSFYPQIILNQGLYPKKMGLAFLRVYQGIVTRRVEAKHKASAAAKAGDKELATYYKNIANSLKIVLNGLYGKFGSKYAVVYAPDLIIQVTLTGQLVLLMLIERLELAGIPVVSANTDGIVMSVPRHMLPTYEVIVKQWELDTHFETEETEYVALFSRDVNNYIALGTPDKNGNVSIKSKGAFANPWSNKGHKEPWMHKNPSSQVCITAVEELLTKGTPVEETIRNCQDMSAFISLRAVTGGAVKVWGRDYNPNLSEEDMIRTVEHRGYCKDPSGFWHCPSDDLMELTTLGQAYKGSCEAISFEYLGKTVRWYYSTTARDTDIVYAKNGNRVPRSLGAHPLMDMETELRKDIDYDWYVEEARSRLRELSFYK
jgi:hypothetical protein